MRGRSIPRPEGPRSFVHGGGDGCGGWPRRSTRQGATATPRPSGRSPTPRWRVNRRSTNDLMLTCLATVGGLQGNAERSGRGVLILRRAAPTRPFVARSDDRAFTSDLHPSPVHVDFLDAAAIMSCGASLGALPPPAPA